MNTNIDEVMNECNELLDKIDIQQDSNRILERISEEHPEFYEFELMYQSYRTKFSKEYFKGSRWYRGDCLYDWFVNNKLSDNEYYEMLFYIIINRLKLYK